MIVAPVRRSPLLLPALAAMVGVCLTRLVEFQTGELALGVVGLGVLGVLSARLRKRTLAGVAALAATVFLGAWWTLFRHPGPPPFIDAAPGEVVLLEGCVVEPPRLSGEREQFTLEMAPRARVRVSLFPREGEDFPRLRYGQRVEVEARLRPTRNFDNPGAFDFSGYLARRNIYWTASASSVTKVKLLEGACGSGVLAAIYTWRERGLDRLETLYSHSPYVHGVSRALLLGDSARLDEIWKETYRRTGTYHALVISGLHVAVLAGFILFLLRLTNLPAPVVLGISAAVAWLYAVLTGWNVPVVRASFGLTTCLAARFFYRRQQLLNTLAITALVFLAIDPQQIFDGSFQLSFLAVGSIAALATPAAERWIAPFRRGLKYLGETRADMSHEPAVISFRIELRLLAETLRLWTAVPLRVGLAVIAGAWRFLYFAGELMLVSACVQVGLALPMMLYFHRVSITGLVANVITVPAVGVIVPLGFLTLLTTWSTPAGLLEWILNTLRAVLEWHAAREPAWRVPDPPLWLAVLLGLSLISVAALARRRTRWRLVATGCAGALLGLAIWHPFPPRMERGKLELTAIDVGQGDSLLVGFPDGKLMLVDGGGFPTYGTKDKDSAPRRPHFDIGEDVVAPYLWRRSVRRLDVVVMTHPDSDHHGGLPAILTDFRPRELWVGGNPRLEDWAEVREAALAGGTTIRHLSSGRQDRFGGAEITVLGPEEDDESDATSNDQSLVLHVRYGKRSYLLTGDLERKKEWEMIDRGAIPRADVLKVGHHGSRTSTSEEMLEAVAPRYAVISCGLANNYRHPHPEVLERLARRRVSVFRTDAFGRVTFLTDGENLQVEGGPWCVANRRDLSRE